MIPTNNDCSKEEKRMKKKSNQHGLRKFMKQHNFRIKLTDTWVFKSQYQHEKFTMDSILADGTSSKF
jgi:hypothetical protein